MSLKPTIEKILISIIPGYLFLILVIFFLLGKVWIGSDFFFWVFGMIYLLFFVLSLPFQGILYHCGFIVSGGGISSVGASGVSIPGIFLVALFYSIALYILMSLFGKSNKALK